jgi:hypothetical protein
VYRKAKFMTRETVPRPVDADEDQGSRYTRVPNKELRFFFRDALRISLKSPRQALFFLRTIGWQARAARVRSRWKRQGIHVLAVMIFSITHRCNLHCKGCYARALHPSSNGDMSEDKLRSIFAEARELGISFAVLAGGEPLVRPEILDITQQYPEIISLMFTNGTLIDADLNEHYGVSLRWLDEHIVGYQGSMWWLPLSAAVRSRLDVERFTAFLVEKEDLPFDVPQAIQSAADDLDHVPLVGELTHSKEDFSALFCSELVAAGLEAGGAIPSLNCSEVTPLDLLRFAIYQGTYYQLKGPKTPIPGYNTVNPAEWETDLIAEQQTSETGARKRIETIYWAGVFFWAGLVFGAEALGILPQIGGASA